MAGQYLIHSGLPWTSPQKIAIGSAQYINNVIINRGLLNLLNNDYYLDIKSQAINNYIENNVVEHLEDPNIHVSWNKINSLFTNARVATHDVLYYIPVIWNGKTQNYAIIQKMIDLLPRNLNGHSLIICLCHGYNDTSWSGSSLSTVDLDYNCLDFAGFIGGDVVIYSTSKPIKLLGYQTLQDLQGSQSAALSMANTIQLALNNKNNYSASNNLLFQSKGINRNYCTISIKNCQANVYVLNLGIKNNLNGFENLTACKESLTKLPSQNYLINYYSFSNIQNDEILCDDDYLNSLFLYKNSNYSLKYNYVDATSVLASSYQDGKLVYYSEINMPSFTSGNPTLPQYFTFDKEQTQTLTDNLVSNQIRSYIYNWNKDNSNFTLLFLGKLYDSQSNFNHCPIFCDYCNTSAALDYGMYVYLNKLYRTTNIISTNNSKSISNDAAEYSTSFQPHYNEMVNTWGLYVLQFVHNTNGLNDDSYTTPKSINGIPLTDGKMRVNLSFYPLNNTSNPYVLIPNQSTIDKIGTLASVTDKQNYLNTVHYEFQPLDKDIVEYYNYPLRLFANRKVTTVNAIQAWDYYSGDIKNLFFFNKILTKTEIQGIADSKFIQTFNWLSQSQNNIINSISSNSYLGAVYVYNCQNINFIGNKITI